MPEIEKSNINHIKNTAKVKDNIYSPVQQNEKTPLSNNDKFISSKDASSDGKFSFVEAFKNLGRGLISPITSMFSSAKNFLIGTLMVLGATALTIATGGAILPVLIAVGVSFGAIQGGIGIYKIATAKNGDDVEKAFYDMGGAISSIGLSILGARTSLKQAGITTEQMSKMQAVVTCFKGALTSIKNSYTNFKIQAVIDCLKGIPESIRNSYENLKKLYNNLQDLKSHLLIDKATHKKNLRQVQPIADEIYNEEIIKLAQTLGVSVDRVRRILPERILYSRINAPAKGLRTHLAKPKVHIFPENVIKKNRILTREEIALVISHECKHIRQSLFPITQLSIKDCIKCYESSIASIAGNEPIAKLWLLFFKLMAYLRYYSTSGRRIRSLKIPKTPDNRLKAIKLIQDEVELTSANFKLIDEGTTSSYANASLEVDAYMYAILTRLGRLVNDIKKGKGVDDELVQRFNHIRYHLSDLKSIDFKEPTIGPFKRQYEVINRLFTRIRERLLSQGVKESELVIITLPQPIHHA